MKSPFFGVKIITDIDLAEVYPLIDTKQLFAGRWQFKKVKGSEEAYQKLLKQKAWPVFEEWKKRCVEEKILEPKIAYGYQVGDGGWWPLQLVTVGVKAVEKCQWLFAAHQYVDYLYLHGLSAATAEALAEYSHRNILRELKVPFDVGKRLPLGSRISPGYPAWPNLSDQRDICKFLEAEKIGVSLTETNQLVPEYSTSAKILLKNSQ